MKTKFIPLLILTLILGLPVGSAAQHITFALSPWLEPRAARAVQTELLHLLLQQAPAGAHIRVYDGWHLVTVTELTLSDAHRERRHKLEVAKLLGWFRANSRRTDGLTNTEALNLPAVFDDAGHSLPPGGVLVLVGSPLFPSPGEPSFAFVVESPGGPPVHRYPGDGLLTAAPTASPFSVVGRETQLAGRQVLLAHAGEHLFPTPLYKDNVTRFWRLAVQLQGGRLEAFSADRATQFQQAFQPEAAPVPLIHLDTAGRPARMLDDRRVTEQDGTTNRPVATVLDRQVQGALGVRPSAGEPRPVTATASQQVQGFSERAAGATFSIGVAWPQTGADVDLYIILPAAALPLYYGNKESAAGRYLHDHTDANAGTDYEQVILNQTPPPTMEAWVNLYRATPELTEPLTGTLMVQHQGRTLLGSFQIQARKGNEAANAGQRATDPHWTRLNWQSLLPQNVALVP